MSERDTYKTCNTCGGWHPESCADDLRAKLAAAERREAEKDKALRAANSELWRTYYDTPRLRPLFDQITAALASPSTPSPAPLPVTQCPACRLRFDLDPTGKRDERGFWLPAPRAVANDELPERSEAGAQPEAGEPQACETCGGTGTYHELHDEAMCDEPLACQDCCGTGKAPSPGPASEPKEPQP